MSRRKQFQITPENVGEQLKSLREQQGITQTQLADTLGVDFKLVLRTEKGQNSPSFDNLYKIATALGYKVALV